MQRTEKKTKCSQCGTMNPPGLTRCRICTRPLISDPLPTQAVFDEALWSRKVASRPARQRTSPYLVLVTAIAVGLMVNYFSLGYGPSWMHEARPIEKAADWKLYDTQPDFEVDLPGLPTVEKGGAAGISLTTSSVWVDREWHRIRDEETNSIAALDAARRNLHAGLFVASGTAPPTAITSIDALLASMAPGSELDGGTTTSLQDPPYGAQYDVERAYSNWPEASEGGVLRARVILFKGKIFIAATLSNGTDDAALHSRLISEFIPAGSPKR